jgi:cellobiose phosphorylase
MGYTAITSKVTGIKSQVRFFIPLGENLEIWEITVTNLRQQPVNLSVFSAVEFCLWDAQDDASNFQRNYSIGEVEVVDNVIYHKSEYRERRNHFAYFACSEPLAGFDTQRESFLGSYRGWDSPLAVEIGLMNNSIAYGWQPIGAQHIKLHLEKGEEKRITFVLGYHENPPKEKFESPDSQTINKRLVKPIIARYLQTGESHKAFQELKAYWDGLLEKFQVNTPDEHTNRMVNIWNAYQVMVTFNFSRSASYFESGIGRGMGFRDSNQDLLGFMHLIPERARERILDLAATQLPNGGAYHQYQPLTRQGNNDIGSGFNDDPLWLILSVAGYIKETGDWDILDMLIPYDQQVGSEETLYQHMQRSIQYTQERIGPHGLPLIGHADWNDCLNLNCFSDQPGQSFQTTTNKDGKVAESVFIAGLFVLVAREMLELNSKLIIRQEGKSSGIDYRAISSLLIKSIDAMENAIWTAGWDGEWFRRAFDDFGRPVGSKECEEGQLFIEPQGICAMAGLGLQDGRAEKALNSVSDRLATKHGIVLHQPAYTRYYLHLGEISSYPPGYKENAGIFCHTNPWIMIAEAKIGRGDRAHDYYLRINPSARENISEVHRCEPYVYAQMIAGKDALMHGEAKNSWLTGSASWNYVAITQWILGIRPSYDGLEIHPVIPSGWKCFDAVRNYWGVRYVINVERIGLGNGVRLEVQGEPIKGTIVPIPPLGTHEVRVYVRIG